MAVLAPMPMANESTATTVNPGALSNILEPYRKSCPRASSPRHSQAFPSVRQLLSVRDRATIFASYAGSNGSLLRTATRNEKRHSDCVTLTLGSALASAPSSASIALALTLPKRACGGRRQRSTIALALLRTTRARSWRARHARHGGRGRSLPQAR
jgi:hypothetical protein